MFQGFIFWFHHDLLLGQNILFPSLNVADDIFTIYEYLNLEHFLIMVSIF